MALDPLGKGLMGTLLRDPYEVFCGRVFRRTLSGGTFRAGRVRNRSYRSHQPEARRQTYHRLKRVRAARTWST